METPPEFDGAVHVTFTDVSPRVPATDRGALGFVIKVTVSVANEVGLVPFEFFAVAVNEYCLPISSPVTSQVRVEASPEHTVSPELASTE